MTLQDQKEKIRKFGDDTIADAGREKANIVVLPLFYESSPSYGTGARSGPGHILDASGQLENLDEETLADWGKLKIHTRPELKLHADPERAVRQMKEAASEVLRENKFLLSLGGDHAASIGPVLAAAESYPKIGILQVDAHLDLRGEWNGSRYNHACVMRRTAADLNLPAVQVGIRSFSKEEYRFLKTLDFRTFFAHDIDPWNENWAAEAVDALPETVYLTIDLDGLDPAVVPGTGTPEPGGLTYRQLVSLIRQVGRERKVIAADITELAKIDGSQVSEYTAAKIATKIFVHCFARS